MAETLKSAIDCIPRLTCSFFFSTEKKLCDKSLVLLRPHLKGARRNRTGAALDVNCGSVDEGATNRNHQVLEMLHRGVVVRAQKQCSA